MIRFALTFLITFVLWLLFTLSSDSLSLLIGVLMSLIVALLAHKMVFHKKATRLLNPMRLGAFILYILLFIYIEIKSHLDVSYSIITGKIKPAMVEVPIKLRRDSSIALLGNTITLTPGTLTVKTGSKFTIHWLNYNKNETPGKIFEKLGGMVTE